MTIFEGKYTGMAHNNKAPQINRREDGTASVRGKPTVYTQLHFYRKSDVLVQLTKAFCRRFLPAYGDRTVDQMVQAARSIKQTGYSGKAGMSGLSAPFYLRQPRSEGLYLALLRRYHPLQPR